MEGQWRGGRKGLYEETPKKGEPAAIPLPPGCKARERDAEEEVVKKEEKRNNREKKKKN